jgi:hypothetical protein
VSGATADTSSTLDDTTNDYSESGEADGAA